MLNYIIKNVIFNGQRSTQVEQLVVYIFITNKHTKNKSKKYVLVNIIKYTKS